MEAVASASCDHPVCAVVTHNLQAKAIEDMVAVVLKSIRQLMEGVVNEAWINLVLKLLAKVDMEGLEFDPNDHRERLFVLVTNKMLDTPILYVTAHKKCNTSLDMFLIALRDLLDLLNCADPAAPRPNRFQHINLAKAPVSPLAFLDMETCQYMCEPVLEQLLTIPAVHMQLLAQIDTKMPAFVVSKRVPGSRLSLSSRLGQKPKRRGFFGLVED